MATITPVEILDSLRRGRAATMSQVRRVLDHAVATGRDAADVARHIGRYFSPWFSRRRSPTGGVLRDARAGLGSWPAAPGMSSQAVRALMLHETSNAHGEAVVRRAEREDLGVRWRTSPGKRRPDECDDKAHRDTGYGPGVYESSRVPMHPSHRLCRCVLDAVPLRRAA